LQSVIMEGMVAGHQRGWSSASPRGALSVIGRPLIEWVIEELINVGATSIFISANGYMDLLYDRFKDLVLPEGIDVKFTQELTPRGPAGAIRDAYDFDKGGSVIVAEGGLFFSGGLGEMVQEHNDSRAALTMAVSESSGDFLPVGIYILSREAVDMIPGTSYVDIKEQLIPLLTNAGLSVRGHAFKGESHKIFKAGDQLCLARRLLCGHFGDIYSPGGLPLKGQPVISDSARIAHGALIKGPVFVDEGAVIHEGAAIIGPAQIGKNCVIGCGALITDSILDDGCEIEPGLEVVGRIVNTRLRRSLWTRLRAMVGAKKESAF